MSKAPKYIPDIPHGNDFFDIHSQIATTLFDIIKTEDISKHSFTLGLLGEWGSGKSQTIRILKEKVEAEKDILFIEFDVWKYVDTSLYRSILIDLENDLVNKANNNLVPASFKKGIKNDQGEKLYDALYNHSEFSIPKETTPEGNLNKLIENLESNRYTKIASYILLRPISTLRNVINYLASRLEIVYFIILVIALFSTVYYYKSDLKEIFPFLKNPFMAPIFKFIVTAIIGLSALEIFKEFFKDFFKELLPKTTKNVVITSPPTFAQDQFEFIFKKAIADICNEGNKKVVLIFDNIDRCETPVTLQILTGLKTFLDIKGCFYIIPCDDGKVKDHFNDSNKAKSNDDFLDKIFQAYMRIPPLEEESKIKFIEDCITKAEFELSQADTQKIIQILTLAYKGNTPRQIKKFFNDFISYYKLAKVIDSKHSFLLKDIGHFTFMIAIKQKWLKAEEILIKNPMALKNFRTVGQNEFKFPDDCYWFIDKCFSWIDLERNPTDFIYLKENNQTGSNVQKIIIDGVDDFNLNQALINDIDKLINSFLSKNQSLFLELSIDRLQIILKKYLVTDSDYFGKELFKYYIKYIIAYDNLRIDNKKQSYILTHYSFLSEKATFIKFLDRNSVIAVQSHFVNCIKQTGFNDQTSVLFKAIVANFNFGCITKLFEDVNATELDKIAPFITVPSADEVLKFSPLTFIKQIASAITLTKDEPVLINAISHLLSKPEIIEAKQILATKATATLTQVVSSATPHAYDKFILKALTLLDKKDWIPGNKPTFDTQLISRINTLFQNGQHPTAIEYAVIALIQGIKGITSLFANNNSNNLYQASINNSLFTKITPAQMELIMNEDVSRTELFNTAAVHNRYKLIFDKLSLEYLNSNFEKLCANNANCLNSLMDYVSIKRTAAANNTFINELERKIIDFYFANYKALLFGNYQTVLPKIASNPTRLDFIEKAVHYFYHESVNNNAIVALLGDITLTSATEINDKIYEANKIQLVNNENAELYKTLITNLSEEKKKDYLERCLLKSKNDLKANKAHGTLLQSIVNYTPSNLLISKSNLVEETVSELLETSRSEPDNTIGTQLLKKLRESDKQFIGSLSEKINLLNSHETKTPALKELLKPFLN